MSGPGEDRRPPAGVPAGSPGAAGPGPGAVADDALPRPQAPGSPAAVPARGSGAPVAGAETPVAGSQVLVAGAGAPTPGPAGGPGALAVEVATMVGRSVRLMRRQLDTLLLAVLLPVMLMALFVYVFGGAIDRSGDYVNYVVPGILLLCVGYGAASTAIPVAADMNEGTIDRFRSMPIHSSVVLAGHVAAGVARNAVSTAIVVLAALAMGFRPDATAVEWLALAGLLTLYVLGLSWVAAGLGAIARTPDSASAVGFFLLFLPYLSSAFVETSTMPGPLRAFSDHQPVTPVTETARGLLTGTPIGSDGWAALAWTTGLVVAGIALATALYRHRSRA